MANAKDQADKDAIPQDVADAANADNTSEEWEEIRVGIGREWDFDKDGALTGIYRGPNDVDLPSYDDSKPESEKNRKSALAQSFGLTDTGEIVFVWGSYELNEALTEVGVDDKVMIDFLGRESFTSEDGPRQVKRYSVKRAVRK